MALRSELIEHAGFQSMLWLGDTLSDLANGASREVTIPGRKPTGRKVIWPYRFDSAARHVGTATWDLLYERHGTKALLIRNGEQAREIDRRFYRADQADFPIAMASVGGRDVLVHCPTSYNTIHMDDIETGERLTERPGDGRPSTWAAGLLVSRNGRYLLDRGWIWSPVYTAFVYDLEHALVEPSTLDSGALTPALWTGSEVESSALLGDDRLAVIMAEGDDDRDDEDLANPITIAPGAFGVWDIPDRRWLLQAAPPAGRGALNEFGDLLLHRGAHASLIDPTTAEIVHAWSEFGFDGRSPAPVAIDPTGQRLAISHAGRLLLAWHDD